MEEEAGDEEIEEVPKLKKKPKSRKEGGDVSEEVQEHVKCGVVV